jgi:hypothetical protein
MARIVSRALLFASRSPLHLPIPPPLRGAALLSSAPASSLPFAAAAAPTDSLLSWRGPTATPDPSPWAPPLFAGFFAGIRGFRRGRRGQAAAKRPQPQEDAAPPPLPKESEIELYARVGVEEDMPDDPEVLVRIALMEPLCVIHNAAAWCFRSDIGNTNQILCLIYLHILHQPILLNNLKLLDRCLVFVINVGFIYLGLADKKT